MTKILALSGSLRKASLNSALLRTAAELAPEGMTITQYDYADVPLFNEDLGIPDAVAALRDAISASDALLIATPEYNYGITGVLKNAVDWASKPTGKSSLAGRRVAILSASPSMMGGARAQHQLRNSLFAAGSHVFPYPEYAITMANTKIDETGLTDEVSRKYLVKLLEAYQAWLA